jgi:membrane protease YdiL (CAAX protease family)
VILIGAIIPGIVEELFFRGVIQTQLQARLISHHNAIFFSAFIFSVLHFQFYGLLPRMIMGLILGYMFYWSKNIWYPVLVHIVNNTIGVIGIYFFGTTILEPYNKSLLTLLFVVISFVLSVFIILHLKRIFYFRRR